jgi:hypothetical protein
MEVTCPNGHTLEIMDPDTSDHQLIGVSQEGDQRYGVLTHTADTDDGPVDNALVVKCSSCDTTFVHELGES